MKSNITMGSNIYVRVNDDIQRDVQYVHQITGKQKLKELKGSYCFGSLSPLHLTAWQESILEESATCSPARDQQASYGLILKDGEIKWEGRCEYLLCPRFAVCTGTAKFKRVINVPVEIEREESPVLKYEWLDIENIEEIFSMQNIEKESQVEIVPEESVIENIRDFTKPDEYKKIDNPSAIISAPIDSKILVNAAPGSGKTYTVIKRLEFIISNQLVEDFSSVLVLVYTNAAKREILNRLEGGVSEGLLPYSARNIDICTFDSLATSYLATINEQFANLDYNGRIHLFNDKFKKENFSNFEYVIVDELQDLVNERAIMTLNILSALCGGYILLGDKCQAIYDYDCHEGDSISSVEFYKRLDALLPDDVTKYELIGNQRQIASLAKLSDGMRRALLELESIDANKRICNEINNINVIGSVESIDFSSISKRAAILCRNNGESEYISHMLHKKRIAHTLLRSIGQAVSFNRWIADCLWDYQTDSRISKEVFIDRYCNRVADDTDEAAKCFDSLCEITYGNEKSFIEIEKLTSTLCRPIGELPELLLNSCDSNLTISTIHKAKGREFDVVYLLDSGFTPDDSNTEEARVWYVGCTRAKNELRKIGRKKQFLKRSETNQGRWKGLGNHKAKWSNVQYLYNHCNSIVVGLPKDVLSTGFVAGDLDEAIETQEYISMMVAVGDEVELILMDRNYFVYHNGRYIGCLNANLYNEFWGIAKENVLNSDPPPYLSPVFITNIVTITPECFPDGISAYFRGTKFWLGVELSGFPKIDWHYVKPQPIAQISWEPSPYSDWATIK